MKSIIIIIFIIFIIPTAYAQSTFLRSGGLRVISSECARNSGCVAQATRECLPLLNSADTSGNPQWFECLDRAKLAALLVPTLTPTSSPRATSAPTPTLTPRVTATATPRATATTVSGGVTRPTPTSGVSTSPAGRAGAGAGAGGGGGAAGGGGERGSRGGSSDRTADTSRDRTRASPTTSASSSSCQPRVTSVRIGNSSPGYSANINLAQYGCTATHGSTCQVTALVTLSCGTPRQIPVTLAFTYTGQAGSGGGDVVEQTCQALGAAENPPLGGSDYCATVVHNDPNYDCASPNQVVGQTTADSIGCYDERLVNPVPTTAPTPEPEPDETPVPDETPLPAVQPTSCDPNAGDGESGWTRLGCDPDNLGFSTWTCDYNDSQNGDYPDDACE